MTTGNSDIRALFERAFHHAADYREAAADLPASPEQDYRGAVAAFAAEAPETPEPGDAILDELVAKASPGLQRSASPRFFGWVIGSSHPVGIAADWLTAAWGQNVANHQAAPSASAIEAVAASWILELLDLPRESSVGFVTGTTVANFVCMAAARGELLRRAGFDVEANGLFGAPPIEVLVGDDAHTTVFSALQFLGLGRDRVTRIATDVQGAMRPEAFEAAIGKVTGPAIVVVQAGQLNTGAFDPMPVIAPLARKAGAWIHVDGAFGLWARACPQRLGLAQGFELADSWSTDGHKWLQTPYDCGFAIVRDELAHRRAMTIAASYLPLAGDGERDPSHYVPELSRRARGIGVWAVIKALGRQGIAELVERHCRQARAMADTLAAEPGVVILNDVALNQVVVRFGVGGSDEDADRITQAAIARIQSDGVCFAGGARWRGRQAMRISVAGWATSAADGQRSVEAMLAAYRAVRGNGPPPVAR